MSKVRITGTLMLIALACSMPSIVVAANWGSFQRDGCSGLGTRQYSARLWNIAGSWEVACASTPAIVNGVSFVGASRCVNKGTLGMWGEFDVPDASCMPTWGAFKKDACSGDGVRQYSAVLENIPAGVSWEAACASTPATVNGFFFVRPTRCVRSGPLSIWGEFDVRDASCATAPPRPAIVTKPSDVFFYEPGTWSPGTLVVSDFQPENKHPGASIVARNVVLRGWLALTPEGEVAHANVGTIGVEDIHYQLRLDFDFIRSHYGAERPSILRSVLLPGNPQGSSTRLIPFADRTPGGTSRGIDINSFWLPCSPTDGIAMELNCWHRTASNDAFGGVWAFRNNYVARGAAPAGWVKKEYPIGTPGPDPLAADSWWPWDPDNPDGRKDGGGNPLNLSAGEYVEVEGTLFQDGAHGCAGSCWDREFPGDAGWLEIHPPDTIRRIERAQPVPDRAIVPVTLCAGPGETYEYSERICPEGPVRVGALRNLRAMTPRIEELIDGRFTTGPPATGGAMIKDDCVDFHWRVRGTSTSSATFKATYIVSWLPGAALESAECADLRAQIARLDREVEGLQRAEVGLDPRNYADRARIAQLSQRITTSLHRRTALTRKASLLGCRLSG